MDDTTTLRHRTKTGESMEPVQEETPDLDMGARASRSRSGSALFHQEGCAQVLWRILKTTFTLVKSTAGIVGLLILYTIFGGWIFSTLEAPAENLASLNMTDIRERFLNDILAVDKLKDGMELSGALLNDYEEQMYEFFRRGRVPEKQPTWTLMGGCIYCITVYTTIGYGQIAPKTDGGKIGTIIYALIGIPLCLMVLADLGRLLTRLIKGILTIIRLLFHRYYYRGHLKRLRSTRAMTFIERKLEMKDEIDTKEIETVAGEEFNFPVPVAVAILVIYLFGCAAIYAHYQSEWSYIDSIYFLFISVSTIGFGDLVPNAQDQTWFLLSTLLVFIGLSLVSMIINVLIDFISNLVKQARRKVVQKVNQMGGVIGLDLRLGSREPSIQHEIAPKAELEDLSSSGEKSPKSVKSTKSAKSAK